MERVKEERERDRERERRARARVGGVGPTKNAEAHFRRGLRQTSL